MKLEPIVPDWRAPANVHAMVTTRSGGSSRGAFASLNLGFRAGDEHAAVEENRRRLSALLPGAPRWLRQVHGTNVVNADALALSAEAPEADAAVARAPNTVCALLVADCMPVLLADEQGSVVGAAHAGWRGLSAGVIEATVAAMRVPASRLQAWLGPAIGPRAYEVGGEVREAFLVRDERAAMAFSPTRPGHWLLDLYAVARQRLRACGVHRVSGGSWCTHSEPQHFFSFRRDRETGRMAALIWLA
jgi:polyphenol oxidase